MRCPHCYKDIADDTVVCTFCGRPLPSGWCVGVPANLPSHPAPRATSGRALGARAIAVATILIALVIALVFALPRLDRTQVLRSDMEGALARGDFEETLAIAATLSAVEPKNASDCLLAGLAYEGLSRDDEAAEAFEQAIALDPGLHAPYARLIARCGREGRPKDAEAIYARWLAHNPGKPNFEAWTILKEIRATESGQPLFAGGQP